MEASNPHSRLDNVRCVVLPGRYPLFEFTDIYNNTYALWEQVYTKVYRESPIRPSLCADAYHRQDQVLSLLHDADVHGANVIGCILFSYHSTLVPEPKYFSDLSCDMVQKIWDTSSQSLMIMEFLTVHPEWRRRSKPGLRIAEVLLGLAMRAFADSDCKALVGTPRVDRKVDETCNLYEGQRLGALQKSGYPCECFLFLPSGDHRNPSPDIQALIDRLWESRTDTTRRSSEPSDKTPEARAQRSRR